MWTKIDNLKMFLDKETLSSYFFKRDPLKKPKSITKKRRNKNLKLQHE
tara:strand:+ start:104 stop:247 length:144 start_codon:yes stop_codon:yes gene_type:complete